MKIIGTFLLLLLLLAGLVSGKNLRNGNVAGDLGKNSDQLGPTASPANAPISKESSSFKPSRAPMTHRTRHPTNKAPMSDSMQKPSISRRSRVPTTSNTAALGAPLVDDNAAGKPSTRPTREPTGVPNPAAIIIDEATPKPSARSTREPTGAPNPTAIIIDESTPKPSARPTREPTGAPNPTAIIIDESTPKPSARPTREQFIRLTEEPTTASIVDEATSEPSARPTRGPSISLTESQSPTTNMDEASAMPSARSSKVPTISPTKAPSSTPIIDEASLKPSARQTAEPSITPTRAPSLDEATSKPSAEPTREPTEFPSPTVINDKVTPETSFRPTREPSASLTSAPSTAAIIDEGTPKPSAQPTMEPSISQTEAPSIVETQSRPSTQPTSETTSSQTLSPKVDSTSSPTVSPVIEWEEPVAEEAPVPSPQPTIEGDIFGEGDSISSNQDQTTNDQEVPILNPPTQTEPVTLQPSPEPSVSPTLVEDTVIEKTPSKSSDKTDSPQPKEHSDDYYNPGRADPSKGDKKNEKSNPEADGYSDGGSDDGGGFFLGNPTMLNGVLFAVLGSFVLLIISRSLKLMIVAYFYHPSGPLYAPVPVRDVLDDPNNRPNQMDRQGTNNARSTHSEIEIPRQLPQSKASKPSSSVDKEASWKAAISSSSVKPINGTTGAAQKSQLKHVKRIGKDHH